MVQARIMTPAARTTEIIDENTTIREILENKELPINATIGIDGFVLTADCLTKPLKEFINSDTCFITATVKGDGNI